MFTGIIEALGEVLSLAPAGQGARIVLTSGGLSLGVGDSIAVDGVCLTVVRRGRGRFEADLSSETLHRTVLAERRPHDVVNLELPLRVGALLGGHFVLGHVDVRGRVHAFERDRSGARLVVSYPRRYDHLIVEKGSLAVNGVSLTVARRGRGFSEIALIPHTLEVTNLGTLGRGAAVHVEFDYLAKLVQRAARPG